MFILFIVIKIILCVGPRFTKLTHTKHVVMDFDKFNILNTACKMCSQVIYENLLLSVTPTISSLMMGVSSPGEHFCFRIPMGDGSFTQLSVSVPPDAMGNRGPPQDASPVPECIETALVGPDGRLVYIEGLGYSDIRRFYGDRTYRDAIPDLEAEILRLLPYARGEVEIPEEYPDSEDSG